MENFEDGDETKYLNCFHRYHAKCIDEWLKKNSMCPICK